MIPDDVKALALPSLAHRIIVTADAVMTRPFARASSSARSWTTSRSRWRRATLMLTRPRGRRLRGGRSRCGWPRAWSARPGWRSSAIGLAGRSRSSRPLMPSAGAAAHHAAPAALRRARRARGPRHRHASTSRTGRRRPHRSALVEDKLPAGARPTGASGGVRGSRPARPSACPTPCCRRLAGATDSGRSPSTCPIRSP